VVVVAATVVVASAATVVYTTTILKLLVTILVTSCARELQRIQQTSTTNIKADFMSHCSRFFLVLWWQNDIIA